MLLLAFLVAAVLKKPTNEEDEIGKEIESSKAPAILADDEPKTKKDSHAHDPPPREQLILARQRRIREKKIKQSLQQLLLHGGLLLFLFFTIYSMQDVRAYLQSAAYKSFFVEGSLKMKSTARMEEVCAWNK